MTRKVKCWGHERPNDWIRALGNECTIFALYWLPINNIQTNDCDNTVQALSSL